MEFIKETTMVLTYEEFKRQYCRELRDDAFNTADEMRETFKKFHGLDLDEEMEKINRREYDLYLQRVQAGAA
jgi:hypothetical protein